MLSDLRYALRWLRRSPGFAAVAILSLGLGIGVNTAMFSLVDAVLLRPLPVRDPGSLADVFTSSGDGADYATTSFPDFQDLKAQNTVFSDMTAYTPMFAPLGLGDRARLVLGQLVTANHFDLLGVRPFLGRLLQPADDSAGAERVVVISHRMWQTDFGSDANVVGRTLQLRGQPYTIVGVAPQSFTGVIPLIVPELWLPIIHVEEVEPAGMNDNIPSPTGRTRIERRGARSFFVKGRLKPEFTAAQAHANVALIGTQLEAAHPQTNRSRRMSAFATGDVRFLVPQASGAMSTGSAAVMAVVGLVLLIACANVTGMLLARASARTREVSVRLAIGASRWQLVRQMLTEGVVLGVAGALVAAGLAWAVIRMLISIRLPIPGTLVLDLRLDWRVLSFAMLVAVAAGLVTALTPALKAASPHLSGALRGELPTARAGNRRVALRDALVVGQLALTAVLLVIAGLMLRSLNASMAANVGFRSEGLALVATDTDMVRYSPERGVQFWKAALERVKALPGVESAALASPRLPFDINRNQTSIRIDGRDYPSETRGDVVANVSVSPDYFTTLGVSIVEGRGFTDADREGTPRVAIVNQAMARRYWPNESAVGKTFRQTFGKATFTIVGVSADHRVYLVNEAPTPYLHFAEAQQPSRYNFLLARTRGDAAQLLGAMRRELLAMEPGLVFVNSATMSSSIADSLLPPRIAAWLAMAFGALGTLLAAIGLYGVIAFSVARRTREIGVRMAIGASQGTVLGLVMRQGLTLAFIGALVGGVLAALAARVMSGALFGVGMFDPVAWTVAIAALLGSATLANFVPARRAMRVNPVAALRTE
jgi:predicted permease